MKATAFFSNTTGDVRLDVEGQEPMLFDKVSNMVNYCNDNGIEADCVTEG